MPAELDGFINKTHLPGFLLCRVFFSVLRLPLLGREAACHCVSVCRVPLPYPGLEGITQRT